MALLAELKRRNVVRVGIAYVVIGWLAFQLGEIVLPTFGAPEWVFKTLIFVVVLGLPFALLFAWAFEITPEGIKKTRDVSISTSITASTGRKLNYVIIAALTFALGYFIWERQAVDQTVPPTAEIIAEDVVVAAETEPQQEDDTNRSIAVLPFDDLSPEGDHEWFADGLAEEILNSLARTPDLLVAARTSSFAFKGSTQDVPTIAAALGVEHILEGSVRRSQSRLRVTAQLIRAGDGFHLWSETYDRALTDMIEIQEDVAIEIARALRTAMDPEALARMLSAGTRSIPAYEAYLEGLAYGVSTVTTGDIIEYIGARQAFERAIEFDPEFAEAHYELAIFWYGQLNTANIEYGFLDLTQEEMLERFNEAIGHAIRHARDEGFRARYAAMEAAVGVNPSRALRLNSEYLAQHPNDGTAQVLQLDLLAGLSRYDELRTAIEKYAVKGAYDPYVSGSLVLRTLHFDDRDFIRDIALRAVELRPDDIFVAYQAHRALLWVADLDRASLLLPAISASDLPESARLLAELRQACAENRNSEARRYLERIETGFADDRFMLWIGQMMQGNAGAAKELLRELDEAEDYRTLEDFLVYANFDPGPFPNLMRHLRAEGASERIPRELPYRCDLQGSI
jgi:TolB-like protein